MEVNANIDAEIRTALDFWFNAYSRRDTEGLLSMVAPDESVVFIGTEADENKIGRQGLLERFERDFAQAESIKVTLPWTSISVSGSVAWVAAECLYDIVSGGVKIQAVGRLTMVMEKQNDKWLIVHAHFSVPVAVSCQRHPGTN